jgi:hypothetical protein
MAKFLKQVAGQISEESGVTTSAGAGDVGKLPQLDASGRLDVSLMPTGIGAETQSVLASEAISANDFVNLYNNTGTLNMRKADASNGRVAHGFVKAAVANAASGLVFREGKVTLSGLTPGSNYFLSGTTAGTSTATAPTTATHHLQILGQALSATELDFEYADSIILA